MVVCAPLMCLQRGAFYAGVVVLWTTNPSLSDLHYLTTFLGLECTRYVRYSDNFKRRTHDCALFRISDVAVSEHAIQFHERIPAVKGRRVDLDVSLPDFHKFSIGDTRKSMLVPDQERYCDGIRDVTIRSRHQCIAGSTLHCDTILR